jgi:hypothetical protein
MPFTKFDLTRVTSPAELDLRQPRQQLLEHQPHLHPGQRVAQAQVRAALAEREVVDVRALDVDRYGSGKRVSSRLPDANHMTTLSPSRIVVPSARRRGSPSAEVVDRRRPAQQLLGGLADQRRLRLQPAELVRLASRPSIALLIACRVVSLPAMTSSRK